MVIGFSLPSINRHSLFDIRYSIYNVKSTHDSLLNMSLFCIAPLHRCIPIPNIPSDTMRPFLHFTLRQRVLFNLLFVLTMVIGAWTIFNSPVERYPNIQFGKVLIDTYYPGASPQDVEALITTVIEEEIEDLDNLEYIMSNSYRERSSILIKFIDDSDYDKGFDELRFRIQSILKELPPTAQHPTLNKLDVNDWFPVISVNIFGDRSNRALALIGEELKLKLINIPGVKEIKLVGEQVREFHVILDPVKMRKFGISFTQTSLALKQANIIIPAGDFTDHGGEISLRVDERFRSRDQVMSTIIRKDGDGSFVRISDIAEDGRLAYRSPFVISSVNGKDCITLQLIKTRQGNAINIANATREIIDQERHLYEKEDVHLVLTQDSTVRINDSIRVLGSNLLTGIILICLLMYGMMGFRNAALTTIGIPFSFLVTMTIMFFTGNSINEISLFAFVLVSGIIVDNAIMVVENIYRHLQSGKKRLDAVIDGTCEVFFPIISATLTTIAAFLPMLIMTGSVGDFFAIIPIAVSYALLASLFQCLFILPIHYLEYGPHAKPGGTGGKGQDNYTVICENLKLPVDDTLFMSVIRRFFNRCLQICLNYRYSCLAAIAVLFIIAMVIASLSISGKMNLIKVQLFPDDYSIYYVEISGPVGTSIEDTHKLIKKISADIMDDGPGMAISAQGIAGFYLNVDYMAVWGDHLGHVVVTLPGKDKREFGDAPVNDIFIHLNAMRERIEKSYAYTGFELGVRPEKDGPPTGKDVNIRILGKQPHLNRQLANELLDFLRNDSEIGPALIDLGDDQGQPGRVVTFRINRERVAEYGLTVDQVAIIAGSALNGKLVGQYRLIDEEIDIKLKINNDTEGGLEKLMGLPVIERAMGSVLLSDLCQPVFSAEPGFLNRYNGKRAITLTANIREGSAVSTARVVERTKHFFRIIQENYPGTSLNFAGEHETTQRSFTSLAYAFVIALLLIYFILANQFNSYIQPLIIISSVVFALIGIIFGTFISQTLFTIDSFIAIVGVTGVVVNSSLVLVEFTNKSYKQGLSIREAIVQGANIRLRPIILTTLTTTLGLLPMAIGIPEYSLIWGSMAMTFVTGLCTATFLTLTIVPVEWDLLMRATDKNKNNHHGKIKIKIEKNPA